MVKKLNKLFNGNSPKELIYMEVLGGGPAANCHENSRRGAFFMNGYSKIQNWKKVSGYNITTSDDGELVSAEVHSVVKDIHTGELIDYTTDFCGQEYKMFIECEWLSNQYVFNQKVFGNSRAIDYILNKEKHKDKVNGMEYTYQNSMCLLSDLQQVLEEADYLEFDNSPYTAKMSITKEQLKELIKLEVVIDYSKIDIKTDKGYGYEECYNNKGSSEYLNMSGLSEIFSNSDVMVLGM